VGGRGQGTVTAGAVLVGLLAVYRLTLLVTHDTITERPVEATVGWLNRRKHPDPPAGDAGPVIHADVLEQRAADPHYVVKLLDCPWCVSFWLALPVFASAWWWADTAAWWIVVGGLAGSAFAGAMVDLAHPSGRSGPFPG
jgi:Protein of unknown function (DUF1360)